MDTRRLEAFSDGVFAVAITILALSLAVDGPGHGSLLSQLGARWPEFASYVVSFFIIGIAWVNHHTLLCRFATVDRVLLFLNLVLLLFIVLIPFATSTMATYLTADNTDAHIAGALYGAVLEGMACGFVLIFLHAVRKRRLSESVPPRALRMALLRFGLGLLVYLVAIGVAFISAPIALALIAAAATYYIFEHRPIAEAFVGD